MDGFELVAVEKGDVMIAAFHHDEEAHQVSGELRLVGQATRRMMHDARGADLLLAPLRHRRRGVDVVGERLDLLRLEHVLEGFHLHGGPAVADHRGGGVLLQAREVLRQQRRAHQAVAVGAVAFGAVLAVELGRRLGGNGRY